MKKAKTKSRLLVVTGIISIALLASCAHYNEESGRKTEYNSSTGRFETSDYASAGISSSQQQKRSSPVTEKDLKKP